MRTYRDRLCWLTLFVIVSAVLLAGCKGKDPFKDPVCLNREAGIEDIEFSEDGRRFCFIDAKANVGVVDVQSGQLLWSRSIVADDGRRWSARTWAACELLNEAGDVVAWHDDVSIGQVSIVPADWDLPGTETLKGGILHTLRPDRVGGDGDGDTIHLVTSDRTRVAFDDTCDRFAMVHARFDLPVNE